MSTPSPERRLLDPAALAKVGRLPLLARQAVLGSVSGKHRSPHRGSSLEFAEYREYLPGDDLRRLDWRAYGRSDRFYVKEFEADTNLRLCLLVDGSGSMAYGSAGKRADGTPQESKLQVASRLAALLGYLAVNQGDAVGLSVASAEHEQHLPPRRRPSHLGLIQDALEGLRAKGPTQLVPALHDLAERARPRALVAVFSDLFCSPEELGHAFQHLRFRKHDVAVFHLLERRELAFDFDRTTRFVDLEGGAPVVVEPSILAERYRAALDRYLEQLGDAVRAADVDYQRVLIDEPVEDVLSRFLLARTRGRGRR